MPENADSLLSSCEVTVQQAGYLTYLRHDDDWCDGPRLDCNWAEMAGFWIGQRRGEWLVGLYSGRLYRVCDPGRLPEVALSLLQTECVTPAMLSHEMQASLGLADVTEEAD